MNLVISLFIEKDVLINFTNFGICIILTVIIEWIFYSCLICYILLALNYLIFILIVVANIINGYNFYKLCNRSLSILLLYLMKKANIQFIDYGIIEIRVSFNLRLFLMCNFTSGCDLFFIGFYIMIFFIRFLLFSCCRYFFNFIILFKVNKSDLFLLILFVV